MNHHRFTEWKRRHPTPHTIPGGYERRLELHEYLAATHELTGPITYLEFGVHKGESLKWWLARNEHPDSRFFGFDSFEGLPEDWHSGRPKGHFGVGGKPPEVNDSRCDFRIGWFQDTLGTFLAENELSGQLVVHLDADLYSSTLYVLTLMASRFKVGDVLIFDEFSDVLHEYRALEDFVSAYPMKFEVLGVVGDYGKIGLRVTEPYAKAV